MPEVEQSALIPGVKHVVLVGSGKGGVGKSTVSTNLALALSQAGRTVGLLDADIYGPSMPIMMGAARPEITEDRRIRPQALHGVQVMSIGYLVDSNQAMVWRGPMLNGAVIQLLRDVEWGALDTLLIDLPPGTGDVQLTIAQKVPVTGAAIVTTPQEVALADVVRAKRMFDQVQIPTLGVIENMSTFVCPSCSAEHPIFATGGGQRAASSLSVEFLGSIPIDGAIREGGDAAEPLLAGRPDSPTAEAFRQIAGRLEERIEAQAGKGGRIPIQVVGPSDG